MRRQSSRYDWRRAKRDERKEYSMIERASDMGFASAKGFGNYRHLLPSHAQSRLAAFDHAYNVNVRTQ